ncbi:MAG: N-acetylmuramoyl-L-alanine amidase [Clostridia bacterium]|nr:N-acetylmuramoyl-L-alanine amidase [Clostridia bacterium]
MSDVYVSPSSEHFNTGYGNYGTEERRMNLIADVVEYELTRNGVSTDRGLPEYGLTEIVADSNAKSPKIHVAIQSQAADSTQRGSQIYYYKPGSNGERLAEDIFEFLSPITPTEDIGLSDGSAVFGGLGFYELRKTRAPAVIVKVGFHDNPLDADFIIENTYEIGVAIARGILQYLGIEYKEDSAENIESQRLAYNGVIF